MYSKITSEIKEAVLYLEQGRIIAFPTGTSYGLAVDPRQGHALQRLRNLKGRPDTKTFTIFMADQLWGEYLNLTDREQTILEKFADQPLTLLVKPHQSLSHLSQDGRIGLRVIDHPLMRQLAQACPRPLTATSANLTDRPPCLNVKCILKYFPGTHDHITYDLSLAAILDGGTLSDHPSSTIARLDKDQVIIIRSGQISEADIIKKLQS